MDVKKKKWRASRPQTQTTVTVDSNRTEKVRIQPPIMKRESFNTLRSKWVLEEKPDAKANVFESTQLKTPSTSLTDGSTNRYEAFEDWCKGFERDYAEFSSLILLCKLKMDQARVLAGGWPKPDRVKTAMTLICLEKLADSLSTQPRELLFELIDQLYESIFHSEDQTQHLIGCDILRNRAIKTFYERCEEMEAKNKHLIQELDQLTKKHAVIQDYLDKTKHLNALCRFDEMRSPDNNEKKHSKHPEISVESAIVAAFHEMSNEDQQNLLRNLSLRTHKEPDLELLFTIYNQVQNPNDRSLFLKLITQQNEDDTR